MTESEAKAWLLARVSASQFDKLDKFVALLIAENDQQNLISPSTIPSIWARHIVDSAQLICAEAAAGDWVDIGSGGGLPGIVVAILRPQTTVLVEPRRKRADFLRDVQRHLMLANVEVAQCNASAYVRAAPATIVSARAVATIETLFADSHGFSNLHTQFVLPRGRSAAKDMASARQRWHGVFHVKPSVTEADSGIVVASGVRPR